MISKISSLHIGIVLKLHATFHRQRKRTKPPCYSMPLTNDGLQSPTCDVSALIRIDTGTV